MSKIVVIIAACALAVHGLIHLMGTTVYMRLGAINGLSYKTTMLGGRWDLGERGILVFGALWIVPAIGFVAAAIAMTAGWSWWRDVVVGAALLSLALTSLDWTNAFMGAVTDAAILALVWSGPSLARLPL